jgi:hypothetical protein
MSLGVLLCLLVGCGAVGPPLPPEKIGIEAKIRQQRSQEHSQDTAEEQIVPIGEDEVVLPSLQPIGIN